MSVPKKFCFCSSLYDNAKDIVKVYKCQGTYCAEKL